ncbi:NAD(P)/FAD-dependent oxidoreductase [Dactylosporangium sp. CA-139066]|uniref:NAD(P)/FAD-dependent oxidoreductase n=1 Tax=Dactylosporangium sp. CA-139066 TaxID=3239930 RepID=UPI003D8AD9D7
MAYDVIVVGTRVAGSATALLLARRGLKVLAVDRARFPSDTLSTHQVQPPGVARLRAWGLLEPLVAAGTPMARTATFDTGPTVLHGAYPGPDGVLSPRRTLLDAALLDAAREAGAEVWEGFTVEEVRPGGIAGRFHRTLRTAEAEAPFVVGADGKHSTVAKAVRAREYRARPGTAAACYAYVEGLELTGGEVYARPDRLAGAWPTNDGLCVVYLGVPRERFDAVRAAGFVRSLPPELGERVAAGRIAERVRATTDLPNVFRRPYGPGWALAGDAGLVMDPITGQGIGNALRDAEALAAALADGLGGARPLRPALRAYHRGRDRDRRAMYRITTGMAAFRRDRFGPALYRRIAGNPAEVTRFLGAISGAIPARDYFGPLGLLGTVTGWRPTPRAA